MRSLLDLLRTLGGGDVCDRAAAMLLERMPRGHRLHALATRAIGAVNPVNELQVKAGILV